MSQSRLAELSGVDQASISRFCKGKAFPLADPLVQLVSHISTDRDLRLQLLIAYLRDIAEKCQVAGFDDRHYIIEAQGSPMANLGADLELLADEASKHEDMRDVLEGMARLVRGGREREKAAADDQKALRLAVLADNRNSRQANAESRKSGQCEDASTADQIVLAEVNRRASSSQRNAAS